MVDLAITTRFGKKDQRSAEIKPIKDGPSKWDLIIHSLAQGREDDATVFFYEKKVESKGKAKYDKKAYVPGRTEVHITGLKSEWEFFDQFDTHPELGANEMFATLRAEGKDHEYFVNAWWFEGHMGAPAHPVWGIYNAHTREGVLAKTYTGCLD